MITAGISVFAFDFSGSGLSGGEFVSLGMYEQEDIHTVVNFLRKTGLVSHIALWGRSMGAVSAILYASTHRSITALALDSPFASFKQVTQDFASAYKLVPRVLSSFFIEKVRKHILSVAGFDIYAINPIDKIQSCDMPALFIHAKGDKLIGMKHSEQLFQAYPNHEKVMIKVSGSHNATRPKQAYAVALTFLRKYVFKPVPRGNVTDGDPDMLDTTRALLPSMVRRVRQRIKKTAEPLTCIEDTEVYYPPTSA